MPSTRRQFALCSVVLLPGTAGCSDFLNDDPLQEVRLDLLNQTADAQTFHFALEANDGLGQWHTFGLDPGASRQVVIEPAPDREWDGYHAVAGDKRVSGSLLGQGDEAACLQLDYRLEKDEIVALLPTSQPLC